ncbi:hypothetical protein RvY_16724-2 [Ramazzottius varieornatus]|uniref:Uncharacterized protein n=1 Tax=Ramazzottius varieornatus TaxID=947166 RepID=A0A1D1VZI9_RAMVA|nr:hypothetical protein RvY_16724-2 [Ramazzottius varieornatus]
MTLANTAFAQQRLSADIAAWNQSPRENFIVAMTVTNFIIACFIGFISAICAVLVHELRLLSREIRVEIRGQAVIWDMKIEPFSGQEVTTMEYMRRKHGKLVDVIGTVDKSFREMLFFHFLFGLPMLIFGLYVMLVAAPVHEISVKGTILLLAVLSILEMFFVWLWAVRVHIWVCLAQITRHITLCQRSKSNL